MEPVQFSEFRHGAVHELMRLNKRGRVSHFVVAALGLRSRTRNPDIFGEGCAKGFGIDSGYRYDVRFGWNLDVGLGQRESAPKCDQGSSEGARVWHRKKHCATDKSRTTRRRIPWLGDDCSCRQTAWCKGAYRCPYDNGFLYVTYSSIALADSDAATASKAKQVECTQHGSGFATYVCEHLVSNPAQEWCSRVPDEEHKWPDAWCLACDGFFQEHREWNEKNNSKIKIEVLCHHCYERLRSQGTFTEAED